MHHVWSLEAVHTVLEFTEKPTDPAAAVICCEKGVTDKAGAA